MTESSKISFNHRKIQQVDDITDLAMMMFPGNRNQQHAAGRIMLVLKSGTELVTSFGDFQRQYSISRRTLERTRAKLTRLGLIEHVSWMNRRYGGRQGWKLSGRMSTALRQLADKMDRWRSDRRPGHLEKEEVLAEFLRP